jgi:hypothetical protein
VGTLTLVWAVINEVFPGYAPFSRQALKSKVSFQALLDAPGKFGEGLQWVKTSHSCIDRFSAYCSSATAISSYATNCLPTKWEPRPAR